LGGREGDLETTSELEVRVCWRTGAKKGMSAAKIKRDLQQSQALNGWGDKRVKSQNIWGMWRRKSILAANGRCEIAERFKQVKWFEMVACRRTLWMFFIFFYDWINFPC